MNGKTRRFSGILCLAVLALAACGGGSVQVYKDAFGVQRRGFAMYLDMAGYRAVSVSESDSTYTLEAMVVQSGQVRTIAPAGTQAQFRVGDETFSLSTSADAAPVSNANQATVFTQWKLPFKFDKEQASRFAKGPFSAFKIMIGADEYQLGLEPGDAKKFQSNMNIMTTPAPAAR